MTRTDVSFVLMICLGFATLALAQVRTDVPPLVPGAKPVKVEPITVHGKALGKSWTPTNDPQELETQVFASVHQISSIFPSALRVMQHPNSQLK